MAKTPVVQEDEGRLRPFIIYGLIGLALVVGGYLAHSAWKRGGEQLPATLMCKTDGCDYRRREYLQVGEMVPLKCPKCGKMSVVPAFTCRQCGTSNLWNEDRGLKPPTKCTKCGKEHYHGS